jgi:hypothetical protein
MFIVLQIYTLKKYSLFFQHTFFHPVSVFINLPYSSYSKYIIYINYHPYFTIFSITNSSLSTRPSCRCFHPPNVADPCSVWVVADAGWRSALRPDFHMGTAKRADAYPKPILEHTNGWLRGGGCQVGPNGCSDSGCSKKTGRVRSWYCSGPCILPRSCLLELAKWFSSLLWTWLGLLHNPSECWAFVTRQNQLHGVDPIYIWMWHAVSF